MNKMSKNRLLVASVNIFWFGIVFVIASNTIPLVDDIAFGLSQRTLEPLTNYGEWFDSVCYYYLHWGGRIISVGLTQFILMQPKMIYNFIEGLVFVLFVNTIYSWCIVGLDHATQSRNLGCGEKKIFHFLNKDVILLNGIYLMLWFFTASFYQVTIWVNGSIIYMWMHLIVLRFGLIYFRRYIELSNYNLISQENQSRLKFILKIIGMFLFGFLAGLSMEPAMCTMAVGLILYSFWNIQKKYKIDYFYMSGIVGAFIGGCLLLFSPGSRERAEIVGQTSENIGIIMTYAYRIVRETYYGMRYLLIPISIFVFLLIISKSISDKVDYKKTYSLLMIVFAIISIYVMTFSAGWATRVLQFPLAILIIASGRQYVAIKNILDEHTRAAIRRAGVIAGGVMLVFVCLECATGLLASRQTGGQEPFDRVTVYTYQGEPSVIPGNGIEE